MSIQLGTHVIGEGSPPFIVAELSANHNGSLERALRIVEACAAAGAHAVKLQTYTADTMTLDVAGDAFRIGDPASPWHGETLHSLYAKAHTPREWHEVIFRRAAELGMLAFSSPFDVTAVDFLETLHVPAYKIASFEITDLALIRRAAATRKPLIISTGLASIDEIGEAVAAAQDSGSGDIILLKCTSTYPAAPADSNLRTIPDLRARFGCEVGLSDHTPGIGAAVAAVAFGAVLIEKHVTLSRQDGGADAAFSLEPAEFTLLVTETAAAAAALGRVSYGPGDSEQGSLVFRRSLYITRDLQPGDVLTTDNLRAIRPGFGLRPRHLPELLGRRVNREVKRGTPAAWDLVDRDPRS